MIKKVCSSYKLETKQDKRFVFLFIMHKDHLIVPKTNGRPYARKLYVILTIL